MRMRCRVVLFTILTGCGGAPASGPPPPRELLPVVPMRFVSEIHGHEGETLVELAADGTITGGRDGSFHARIDAGRVITREGEVLAAVQPDGHVIIDGHSSTRFDESDALVDEKERIVVDDRGVPSLWETVRRGAPLRLPGHFAPYSPSARRTAALLTLVAIIALSEAGRAP